MSYNLYLMKKILKIIIFIIIGILLILKLISLFIEVPKTINITDINQSKNIKFKMPKGTHFNPYIKIDTNSTLEGNVTIKYNQKIIYIGELENKFLLKDKTKMGYSLIPNNKIHNFFRQHEEYEFEIRIKEPNKFILFELSWLYCGLCG